MNSKIHFLFSFFVFFNLPSINSFNITKLLSEYGDFSTFNTYLNQTGLAKEINSRQTITVLAVNNGNISPLSGKSPDVLKSLMSVHVVLDYYDLKRLHNIPNRTIILTTLFQSSGKARGRQGFVNVTVAKGSTDVKIGSAVTGAASGASLVGSVVQQPFNISVLEISSVIIPQGLDNSTSPVPSPSPRPAKSPSPNPAKAPSPTKHHNSPPSPPPSDSPSPAADAADSPRSDSSDNTADSPTSNLGLQETVLVLISSVLMFLAVSL